MGRGMAAGHMGPALHYICFVGQGPCALPGMRGKPGRADVGSELSAASGRGSEVSEWPRSKFPASAVRQRRNFGHRNRIIGPHGSVTRGAVRRADVGIGPYESVTRGAVRRADVGIGPYGWIFGEYPYTISPKRAQVLLSVIFMSRYWPRADLSPTRCTRRPPAVRPERGQRASSVSPSTRQRRVLPT